MAEPKTESRSDSAYLCRASGEGTADVRLCRDMADVVAFYNEMFCLPDDAVEGFKRDFGDPDHWCNNGFTEKLYCADFECWRVPAEDWPGVVAPRSEIRACDRGYVDCVPRSRYDAAEADMTKEIAFLQARIRGMVAWLEKNQPDVWKRGIWDSINDANREIANG